TPSWSRVPELVGGVDVVRVGPELRDLAVLDPGDVDEGHLQHLALALVPRVEQGERVVLARTDLPRLHEELPVGQLPDLVGERDGLRESLVLAGQRVAARVVVYRVL